MPVSLNVNGTSRSVPAEPDTTGKRLRDLPFTPDRVKGVLG